MADDPAIDVDATDDQTPDATTTVVPGAPRLADWQPADGAQQISLQPTTPAPAKGKSSLWGTAGASAWQGVMDMGSDALSAASFVTRHLKGASPDAVAYLEQQRHALDNHIQNYVASQPADRQAAMHASIWGGTDENGQHIPTPGEVGYAQYAASALGSLVPDAVLAVLTDGTSAAFATRLGAKGVLKSAIRAGATGSAFGVQEAGEAYKTLVDTVDHASDTEMLKNPVYAHLRQDQGMDEWQAKSTLVGNPRIAAAVGAHFLTGAVTGAGMGSVLTRGAMGAAGRGMLGRAGIGAAEGAATMGVQGAVGDYLNQLMGQQAGPKQDYDPTQTAHALVSGALGGAVMGAAGGAMHGGHTPEAAPAEEPATDTTATTTNGQISAEHQAALQGALDLNHAGPGYVGSNPQGELFRTTDQANQPGQRSASTAPPGTPTPAPGPTSVAESPTEGQGSLPLTPPGPTSTVVGPTTPEPRANVAAQVQALADPNNPKDAVFLAKGTPVPSNLPPGTKVMVRKVGTLLTNNPDKAKLFMAKGDVDEARMAQILNYTESKDQAIASGNPQAVQATDAQGNVVHEQLASPEGVEQATQIAAAHVPTAPDQPTHIWRSKDYDYPVTPTGQESPAPDGRVYAEVHGPDGVRTYVPKDELTPQNVRVTTPEDAQARRAEAQPVHPVDVAAHEAAEPTQAQAEAGNYQKGHVKLHGLDISIETPAGSVRRGHGWEATMPGHYGYVRGTRGADGDHVDVTLGSRTKAMFDGKPADAAKEPVFVVDQIDPATGKFDEHKALVGYHTQAEAEHAYDAQFSDGSGPTRRGAVNEMTFGGFKDWLAKGDTSKAISYRKPTVSDQLKAKRAAQKAKMNPVKVEQAPSAHVDTSEAPEAQAEAPVNARETALQATKVVKFRPGADPSPILDKIIRDLTAHIDGSDGTRGGAAEAVNAWMEKAPKGQIPGTMTGYREIGQRVMHLLGHDTASADLRAQALADTRQVGRDSRAADVEDKLAETGGKIDAEEARTLVSAEKEGDTGAELDAEPTTVVEEPGAETSVGLTQDFGAEKQRSAQTSNLDRRLHDLESKIVNGTLTAKEAEAEFGTKAGKTLPQNRSLRAWLEHRIKALDNPEAEKAAMTAAAKAYNDPKLPKADKDRVMREAEREFRKFDPEYVQHLRDALDELDGEAPRREAASAALDVTSLSKTAQRQLAMVEKEPQVLRAMLAVEKLRGDRGFHYPTLAEQHGMRPGEWEAEQVFRMLGRGTANAERARRFDEFARVSDRIVEETDRLAWDTLKQHGVTRDQVSKAYDRLGVIPEKDSQKVTDYLRDKYSPAPSRARGELPRDYARTINRSAANDTVVRMLRDGQAHTLRDYLHAIIADPAARRDMAPLVALARRMLVMAKPELKVFSYEGAARHFDDPAYARSADRAGEYFLPHRGREGFIAVEPSANMPHVETLLHEAMHSITSNYLDDLPTTHPHYQTMDAIRQEMARIYDTADLSPGDKEELGYALSNVHEMHTMLMSNPVVQRIAAEHTASPELTAKLRGYGFARTARSVWNFFTTWLKQALGMQSGSAENSVLDHVMRPLQDITDRAAQHEALNNLTDIASHALPNFSRAKDDVVEKIDPKGLGDAGRRALLTGATTDGIVKWNRDLFAPRDGSTGNSLENYRSAGEAISRRAAEHHEKFGDQVRGMITDIQGPDRDKLAQIMVDTTLANARVGKTLDADANAHLKDPTAAKDLQAQFNKLPPKAQATYEKVRDYFAKTYRTERDAQLTAMVKTALPDATPEQVKRVTEAARTKKGIERLIAGADTDPVAAAFGDAWEAKRRIVQGIGKVHRMGWVDGDYFPLKRFGDYVVRYGEKGEDNYGVEMFERASEAEARRSELVKQGAENVSQVLSKRDSKLKSQLNTTVVDEMASAMGRNKDLAAHVDDMRDLMQGILLQHASHSEAARASLRRRGVKGASTQVERVIAQDFLSTASRLGYLEHGVDRTQALQAMQRHVDYLDRNGAAGEQRRAQAVLHELQSRTPQGDDASGALSSIARRFSTLGFVQSLMSPSHMLTSTIEAHMNSSALLGARHGAFNAALMLTRALKDIAPSMAAAGTRNTLKAVGQGLKASDWSLGNMVRDKLIKGGADRKAMTDLFGKLSQAGLLDHTMDRELQRIANPASDVTRGWWQRFLDLNAAGAHAVDVANKAAIAKAAYDLEMRKFGNHDKAVAYALDTARQAMPNYNLGNKPRIATDKGPLGSFAGPLTQFKMYGAHMYSVMANLVRTSIQGASRSERMEARKAFAGILATHALMAGSLTLIGDPLRWIGGAYDLATGADKPHDYENDVRRWIADAFGPELGEIVSRGVPHAAGIDIHRRVGLSNLLEPPELNSFDKKGFLEAVASAMTGAAGEDAATMAAGLVKLRHGDVMGGLQAIVPRVFRDPVKAYNLSTTGVTDSKGKTIVPPNKLSSGDITAQALGFQPAKVSEFREGRAAVMERMQEVKAERDNLLGGMLSSAGDDRLALLDEVRRFNTQNPGQPITYAQILKAQQAKRTAAMQPQVPGSFGLKIKPQNAKALTSAGSFANVN